MALLAAVVLSACSRSVAPPLPTIHTAALLPAVRDEIEAAQEQARQRLNDGPATGRLCMLLDAHDQPDAAAQCYARVLFLDPGAFEWPYHLAVVRMTQGRYADAVESLRAALRIRHYQPAVMKLAQCLRETGAVDESLRLYSELVKNDGQDAEAWYGLGRVQEQRRDTTAAEASYRRACELYPAYGSAQYALALLLKRKGDESQARQRFEAAEQHKTEVPGSNDTLRAEVLRLAGGTTAFLRRAAEFEKAGRVDEAIRENVRATDRDPALLQAHINLIGLYGRVGRYEEAEKHYTAALNLPGGKADADYNYGVLLVSRERPAEAQAAFQRALAANPQHAQAHHNLGFLLEQQGKFAAALEQYEAAVSNQTDYRLAHFHAGRLLAAERQYAPAIDHLRKTIEPVDESTPAYLYALSAAYARSGQYGPAVEFGERARSEAAVRGQTGLLASIDRDLNAIKARFAR